MLKVRNDEVRDEVRKTRRFWKAALVVCGLALAVFLVDYLALRLPIPPGRQKFGSVTVHRFYRIPLKSGKTEVQYDGDYAYDCVHALFPHFGDKPCWYLNRRTEQWIDINSGTANNPHLW